MQTIDTIEALEARYGEVSPIAARKVRDRLTPCYRKWIEASRFAVLSTVGQEGTDASPRGDDGPVVAVADEGTLMMPDWQGNNRLDSLRNIVRDGRVSLMFLVPGSKNVVRVNGRAVLAVDEETCARFEQRGRHPRSVIVVTVAEVYFQCAKSLMRSRLWESGDESEAVPTAGEFIAEFKADHDAAAYDAGYAEYARDRMW